MQQCSSTKISKNKKKKMKKKLKKQIEKQQLQQEEIEQGMREEEEDEEGVNQENGAAETQSTTTESEMESNIPVICKESPEEAVPEDTAESGVSEEASSWSLKEKCVVSDEELKSREETSGKCVPQF